MKAVARGFAIRRECLDEDIIDAYLPFALIRGYVANPDWVAAARELLACCEAPTAITMPDESYVVSRFTREALENPHVQPDPRPIPFTYFDTVPADIRGLVRGYFETSGAFAGREHGVHQTLGEDQMIVKWFRHGILHRGDGRAAAVIIPKRFSLMMGYAVFMIAGEPMSRLPRFRDAPMTVPVPPRFDRYLPAVAYIRYDEHYYDPGKPVRSVEWLHRANLVESADTGTLRLISSAPTRLEFQITYMSSPNELTGVGRIIEYPEH